MNTTPSTPQANNFRFWDSLSNKWLDPDVCYLTSDGQVFFIVMDEHPVRIQDGVIAVRSTGLLDKNGKDIFEGDLLKYRRTNWRCPGHPEDNTDLSCLCKVFWSEADARFEADRYNEERCVASGPLKFDDSRADENIIEIIGNIYENPDLLPPDAPALQ